MVLTMLYIYLMRNFSRLIGLEPREPLAGKYDRGYFRATWVATALDAGFWKAMWLKPKFVRDIASIGITLYYLVCAEQADEYVRKVRAGGSDVDHMRVAWNKGKTPYIKWSSWLMRPRWCMSRPPVRSMIQRPKWSQYQEPIAFWTYFDVDDPQRALKHQDKIILDVPGGGFVAMDPRCHDDKLFAWAGKSGLPVIALDYKKAPEYPYPYALDECFEAYCQIIETRGRCIGLSGNTMPKIVLSGDSAGGNLATGLVVKLLETSPSTFFDDWYREPQLSYPLPEALILVYPALHMDISSFMRPEDVALLNRPEYRGDARKYMKRKSQDYRKLTPKTPHASSDEDDTPRATPARRGSKILVNGDLTKSPLETSSDAKALDDAPPAPVTKQRKVLRTQVKMTSIITQLHDRVLPPELLRAMILLYIGEQHKPDFAHDYHLSPLLAPEHVLNCFPKVYMLCGEQDPLLDDTTLFAGRLRQARLRKFKERQERGLISSLAVFDDKKHVETVILDGVSHGFLQFVTVYWPGWDYIDQCRRWMMDAFYEAEHRSGLQSEAPSPLELRKEKDDYFSSSLKLSNGDLKRGESSSEAEDKPLEMTPLRAPDDSNAKRRRDSLRKLQQRAAFASGRRSPKATRSALRRLASSEDLLSRRMQGLTGSLLGSGTDVGTP